MSSCQNGYAKLTGHQLTRPTDLFQCSSYGSFLLLFALRTYTGAGDAAGDGAALVPVPLWQWLDGPSVHDGWSPAWQFFWTTCGPVTPTSALREAGGRIRIKYDQMTFLGCPNVWSTRGQTCGCIPSTPAHCASQVKVAWISTLNCGGQLVGASILPKRWCMIISESNLSIPHLGWIAIRSQMLVASLTNLGSQSSIMINKQTHHTSWCLLWNSGWTFQVSLLKKVLRWSHDKTDISSHCQAKWPLQAKHMSSNIQLPKIATSVSFCDSKEPHLGLAPAPAPTPHSWMCQTQPGKLSGHPHPWHRCN